MAPFPSRKMTSAPPMSRDSTISGLTKSDGSLWVSEKFFRITFASFSFSGFLFFEAKPPRQL